MNLRKGLTHRTEVPRIGEQPNYCIHPTNAARRTLSGSLNRQRSTTQPLQIRGRVGPGIFTPSLSQNRA
jgi:hypothetical protein